jgi:predicted enzyme related to lactoylglutathione lyase
VQGLLGAVWLYAADVPRAVAFYRDTLGLPPLEEPGHVAHFDAGGVRLSIHPAPGADVGSGGFYVFVVADIAGEVETLTARGVEFPRGIREEPFGPIAEFRDPDGHELFLWQLPAEGDAEFEHVRPLVQHYQRVAAALGRSV